MRQFNPEMLIVARGAAGFSQSEIAKQLQWSQGKASKIENGLIAPTDDECQRLADCLGYPLELFFQGESLTGFGSCCTYDRKRRTTPIKVLGQLHDQINIKRIQVSKLLVSAEEVPNRIPHLDIDEFDNPSEIARLVRAAWQLPRGRIKDLVSVIEAAGGIVIQCDFPTTKIDAVSQRSPKTPPMFFLNRCKPVDRWRLSLAHELGHIVMHSAAPTPNAEDEADEFAAEFLMPADEIKHELQFLTVARAAALKLKWRVSMQAIIVRAFKLGAIDERKYRSLFVQLSQFGYRKNEPNSLEEERPRRLAELIEMHQSSLGYSKQELAQTMLCTVNRLGVDYLDAGTQRFGVVG